MSGLTLTRLIHTSVGDRYMNVYKADFDSSYPVGGEALLRTDLGFAATDDPEFHVLCEPTMGFLPRYDHTNQKLKVHSSFTTYTATYDPASLAAVTARDDTVTVTGIAATDVVVGYQAAAAFTSALTVQEVRASATNTVTIRLNNPSAGSVDGASGSWKFFVANANGGFPEIADTTDLSALTGVRITAFGKYPL